MKRTDIAMLILIAAAAAGIAYFVAHGIFGGVSEKGVSVKTIDPISSQVEQPSNKIFNSDAINPSVEVNISATGTTTATDAATTPTTTNTTTP